MPRRTEGTRKGFSRRGMFGGGQFWIDAKNISNKRNMVVKVLRQKCAQYVLEL